MRNHKSQRSIFPQKLWRLVNDSRLEQAIRWAPDGLSFVINELSLKRLCLGKENHIFFTRQPKSFIRQLHLYGFRKVNKNQFTHQYFQRGRPDLLEQIRRSYKPMPGEPTSNTSTATTDDNNSQVINAPAANNNQLAPIDLNQMSNIAASNNNNNNHISSTCTATFDPVSWFESSLADISYTYNEDTILTMYNNDIYPNNCDDNNIVTL